jgi:ClpP class serine protease
MRFPHVWSRIYGVPLLLHPEKAKVIEEVFRAHLVKDKIELMQDDVGEDPSAKAEREQERRTIAYSGIGLQARPDKPYAITKGGTAIVPLIGTLVQRGSFMDAMSGLASYDMSASLLDRALADPDVRAVMLEIDSPGGEAYGLAEFADRVYAARKHKPIWATANEQAYSAAYWIGASAQRLYVPITGGVGSIGALALHVDQSERDKKQGYTYTIVRAGDRKARLNAHEPMDAPGLKWLQAEVDRNRDLFVEAVATRRGLSADAVYATEAELLTPPQALDGKYVDGIATLAEAVFFLEGGARPVTKSNGTRKLAAPLSQEIQMTDKNAPALNQAQVAEIEQRAVKAERQRIKDILVSEEAKTRTKLAMHLALETDTTAQVAHQLLLQAAKDGTGNNQFLAAMNGLENPRVGLDGARDGQATQASAAEIFAARKADVDRLRQGAA